MLGLLLVGGRRHSSQCTKFFIVLSQTGTTNNTVLDLSSDTTVGYMQVCHKHIPLSYVGFGFLSQLFFNFWGLGREMLPVVVTTLLMINK